MQGSLISHGPEKKRVAIIFQCDGQTLKSVSPPVIQVSFDADFIKPRPIMVFR
jgi:hypothetical protein